MPASGAIAICAGELWAGNQRGREGSMGGLRAVAVAAAADRRARERSRAACARRDGAAV